MLLSQFLPVISLEPKAPQLFLADCAVFAHLTTDSSDVLSDTWCDGKPHLIAQVGEGFDEDIHETCSAFLEVCNQFEGFVPWEDKSLAAASELSHLVYARWKRKDRRSSKSEE
jgi:hypothetical protein